MKTRNRLIALLAFALLLSACGSDAEEVIAAAEDVTDTAVEAADEMTEGAADEEPAEEMVEEAAAEEPAEEIAEEAAAEEPLPQRIVSLNPTGTEMLFAVGAGPQVVAVDNYSNYPAEAPLVEDLSAYTPSVEAIAALNPDLVVTSAPIEGLDALGVATLELAAANNLDEVYSQIEQVGAATGHVGEAAEVVLQMRTDIDAAVAGVEVRDVPLTYFHELDNTLYSVTSSTFVGAMYQLFGLENAADAADPDGEYFGYPQLNEEFLFSADPDLIFLADTLCCDQSAETVAARPGWDQLRAVASGNVVELNDDVVSRWGPRLVDFVQAIAAAVGAIETTPAG